jgi:hypothetical protein
LKNDGDDLNSSQQYVAVSPTANGTPHVVEVPVGEPLLRVLRDDLQLKGTKHACHEGRCGADPFESRLKHLGNDPLNTRLRRVLEGAAMACHWAEGLNEIAAGGVAPAPGKALFRLTGERVRSTPLRALQTPMEKR